MFSDGPKPGLQMSHGANHQTFHHTVYKIVAHIIQGITGNRLSTGWSSIEANVSTLRNGLARLNPLCMLPQGSSLRCSWFYTSCWYCWWCPENQHRYHASPDHNNHHFCKWAAQEEEIYFEHTQPSIGKYAKSIDFISAAYEWSLVYTLYNPLRMKWRIILGKGSDQAHDREHSLFGLFRTPWRHLSW